MSLNDFHIIAGPFKYILPTYFIFIVKKCLSEYKNKVFFINRVSEVRETKFFEDNNINVADDNSEFYFGVNMPIENKFLPKSDREELESKVLINTINKIENGLADYGIFDLIKFNYEHVDSEEDQIYGWAVACTFNSTYLNRNNIIFCYSYIFVALFLLLLCIICLLVI